MAKERNEMKKENKIASMQLESDMVNDGDERRENRPRQQQSGEYRNAMKVMELYSATHIPTLKQTNTQTN